MVESLIRIFYFQLFEMVVTFSEYKHHLFRGIFSLTIEIMFLATQEWLLDHINLICHIQSKEDSDFRIK